MLNPYFEKHQEYSIVNAILTFEYIYNISTFNILLKFATAYQTFTNMFKTLLCDCSLDIH